MFKMLYLLLSFFSFQLTFATEKELEILNVCLRDSITNLNPHTQLLSHDKDAIFLKIYEPLIKTSPVSGKKISLLLKKWIQETSTSFFFELRTDIQFQTTAYFKPTRILNTDDIIFSFNALKTPAQFGLRYNTILSETARNIDKITKVNDKTFIITLKKEQSDFIDQLNSPEFSILSLEYYLHLKKQNKLERLHLYPIGTGPLIYDKKENTDLWLKKNKFYHLGNLLYDGVHFQKIISHLKRVDMASQNICHTVQEIFPYEIKDYTKYKNLTVIPHINKQQVLLFYNTSKPPFDNITYRSVTSFNLYMEKINKILTGDDLKELQYVLPKFSNRNFEQKDLSNNNVESISLVIPKDITPKHYFQELLLRKLKIYFATKKIKLKAFFVPREKLASVLAQQEYNLYLDILDDPIPSMLKNMHQCLGAPTFWCPIKSSENMREYTFEEQMIIKQYLGLADDTQRLQYASLYSVLAIWPKARVFNNSIRPPHLDSDEYMDYSTLSLK